MQIRIGYELVYECVQPTPMILNLNVHYSRASDLQSPDVLHTDPAVPMSPVPGRFRQLVHAHRGAGGRIRLSADG